MLELTDIPAGNPQVFGPSLCPAIRSAEVVEILREAFATWGVSAETIRGTSFTLRSTRRSLATTS